MTKNMSSFIEHGGGVFPINTSQIKPFQQIPVRALRQLFLITQAFMSLSFTTFTITLIDPVDTTRMIPHNHYSTRLDTIRQDTADRGVIASTVSSLSYCLQQEGKGEDRSLPSCLQVYPLPCNYILVVACTSTSTYTTLVIALKMKNLLLRTTKILRKLLGKNEKHLTSCEPELDSSISQTSQFKFIWKVISI